MLSVRQIFIGISLSLLAGGMPAQKKIDLASNLSNEKLKAISSVAGSIKYIPLETTGECLLSRREGYFRE